MTALHSKAVGVVTGPRRPDLSAGGRALADELRARGATVDPVVWTDLDDLADVDALVLRSCWDYHERIADFRAWLEGVDAADAALLNPVRVVRWNVHKSYLRDLAEAGVDVLDTAFVERGSDRALRSVLEARGWEDAVVKPAVGTSSAGAFRTTRADAAADRERFASLVADGDVLVQRFAPEIRDGERSLAFLGGAFSHAYRRVPADGDFRAHPSFDATVEQYDPADATVAAARAALDAVEDAVGVPPAALPYARVDGVRRDGGFVLMELELVEPWLGLHEVDGAADRLADAVAAAL
ncbi:ATP-grasp domain-containing protein [Halobacterium yunchengense]|uniref:ATP-grasp domain-containing protein n=1 Tax=Halobacterium yunchengense TaxID=3108497 RepID=UPI003008D16F